jgi:hypothetical protein
MAELTTPVRGVLAATDTPLSGIGQVDYGIVVGSTGANEDWLVDGGTQGGVWTLTTPANTWARRSDLDASAEFNNMPYVQVREGNQGVAGSVWYYSGSQNPTINSSQLPFTMRTHGRPTLAGTGLEENRPYVQLPAQTEVPEEFYAGPLHFAHTDRGITTEVSATDTRRGYIEELIPTWTSSMPNISPGAAWIDSLEQVIERLSSGSAPPTPLLSGALHYFYMNDLGFVSCEPTITPDTPYYGTARAGVSTPNSRYVFTLRSNSGGTAFYNFHAQMLSDKRILMWYLEDTTASPFRVVSAAAATTNQTLNLGPSGSKLVPPTAKMAILRITVNTTSGVWLDNSEMSTSPAGGSGFNSVTAAQRADVIWMPLDSSQSLRWANVTTGGSTNIDVVGFVDRR